MSASFMASRWTERDVDDVCSGGGRVVDKWMNVCDWLIAMCGYYP